MIRHFSSAELIARIARPGRLALREAATLLGLTPAEEQAALATEAPAPEPSPELPPALVVPRAAIAPSGVELSASRSVLSNNITYQGTLDPDPSEPPTRAAAPSPNPAAPLAPPGRPVIRRREVASAPPASLHAPDPASTPSPGVGSSATSAAAEVALVPAALVPAQVPGIVNYHSSASPLVTAGLPHPGGSVAAVPATVPPAAVPGMERLHVGTPAQQPDTSDPSRTSKWPSATPLAAPGARPEAGPSRWPLSMSDTAAVTAAAVTAAISSPPEPLRQPPPHLPSADVMRAPPPPSARADSVSSVPSVVKLQRPAALLTRPPEQAAQFSNFYHPNIADNAPVTVVTPNAIPTRHTPSINLAPTVPQPVPPALPAPSTPAAARDELRPYESHLVESPVATSRSPGLTGTPPGLRPDPSPRLHAAGPTSSSIPADAAPAAPPLDALTLEELLVTVLREAARQHGVEGPW